jgi:predicted MFS family arabinose efflux permease
MSTQAENMKLKFSSYEIFVVLILTLTQLTVVLDFIVISPLGDLMMKTMNLSTAQFGLSVSVYAFSAGFSGLATAGFADRFDRKKLLLFFYVGFIVGTLFCGLSDSFLMLLTARVVTGLFGGVIGSISMAIVSDLFPLEKRGRVFGFLQMGFGASQVLGIPLSLYIATVWGWQSPFLMIVVLSIIILLLIMFKLNSITEHLDHKTEQNAITHLWQTLTLRKYRIGFLATAFLSLGNFMMLPWGRAYVINNLKITVQELPFIYMASGVCTLTIMPIIGKLSDRFDKFYLFSFASIILIIVIIIYANLGPVSFWIVLIMNLGLQVGFMSRMVPSIALTSALPQKKDRGSFMGINSSLQQIAGGIAAAVSGMIVIQNDKFSPLEHYDYLVYVVVLLSIISVFLLFRVSRIIKNGD